MGVEGDGHPMDLTEPTATSIWLILIVVAFHPLTYSTSDRLLV